MKFNFVTEIIYYQNRTKSYTENYSDLYSNALQPYTTRLIKASTDAHSYISERKGIVHQNNVIADN